MKRGLLLSCAICACFILAGGGQLLTTTFAQTVVKERGEGKSAGTQQRQLRAGQQLKSVPVKAAATVLVNVADLASRQAATPPDFTPRTTAPPNQIIREEDLPPSDDIAPPASGDQTSSRPDAPQVASPAPASSFLGHNDVVQVGSGSIVIPPDTTGAVGLTRIVTFLNNNYVVQNKTTGAQISAVSIETFFGTTGATGVFDPRILYDPYNDRWIVCAVSDAETANASIVVGVSQTGDPAGTFSLSRIDVDSGNVNWADFPTLGFNKNWVAINVNMIQFAAGTALSNRELIINYPSLRTGVFSGGFVTGTNPVTAPVITYSSTENTLYQMVHVSSVGATYRVDTITGTAAAPTYNVGGTLTRTGGGWTQPTPGGQILPQAAPLSGTSSCGAATPCKLETQDSFIRSTPVFRNGFIYYAQTIGLPAGGTLTRTAVQWTKLTATTGVFSDGGRIDDPTATATNGGKWYNVPAISVNANNDVMLGFSQFASNQYPSAGYTYRFHSDAPGLMRDPLIYKAGEDYYSKTFGGGRNRFGDYSITQVDPSNDKDLWTLQEYAQARVGTDDGTGANSSRWSTWWARVAFDPTGINVLVGGRVLTSGGRNVARATVTLTDQHGQVRTALTNQFGRYQFTDVPTGETFVISVTAKGYEFTPQVLNVIQEVNDMDFTAQ